METIKLVINWIHGNMWALNPENELQNILGYFFFFASIYIMLRSFTYPFITKYGTLFLSITRGNTNEKRRSGIVEFIKGFAFVCFYITPLIKISLVIFTVGIVLWLLDSGRNLP